MAERVASLGNNYSSMLSCSALVTLLVSCSASDGRVGTTDRAVEAVMPGNGSSDNASVDNTSVDNDALAASGMEDGRSTDGDSASQIMSDGEASGGSDSANADSTPGGSEGNPIDVDGVENATQSGDAAETSADGGSEGAGTDDDAAQDPTDTTNSSDAAFQPCPETGPCKILPLGDSITFGLGFDGGYRVELFRLALEAEREITFTGTQAPNGPGMVNGIPFPRNHEGISGETIDQINIRVPSPALNDSPHIILVHAGTNDMFVGANGATERMGSLLDELIVEAPDALIVLSSIIPLSFGANALPAFNAAIPGLVAERADAGAHIIFADQFAGFPTSELGDGVHPNQTGYSRMAGVWFDSISQFLRQ